MNDLRLININASGLSTAPFKMLIKNIQKIFWLKKIISNIV
jgi:hypothetical protein